MSRRPLALVAVLFAVALGCTPAPQETCDKLQKLSEESTSTKKLSMSKCLEVMSEMKERDAQAYKCAAKLVAKLNSYDTAILAVGICDKNRPDKKKTSDDADDEAPKKKKKKAADDE